MKFRSVPAELCLVALLLSFTSIGSGQAATLTNVSAANYRAIVAPDSIVSGWGTALATSTASASSANLPQTLAGVQLTLVDSTNTSSQPGLYMVSPMQINYVVSSEAKLGRGTVTASGSNASGPILLSNVSPAIFTANSEGTGVPAGQLVANGMVTTLFQSGSGGTFTASPIALGSGPAYLVLYGTGIRGKSKNPAVAMIGDTKVPVQYAGSQSQFPGLDQINIGPLPASLAGRGSSEVVVCVDGVPSNPVQVTFQ